MVYALATGTTTLLYLKQSDELEARPIAGTQGARNPFFSPSGQWVGFHDEAHRKLKKVSLSGGEPVVIADSDFQGGAAWAPDDTILFASNYGLVACAGWRRNPADRDQGRGRPALVADAAAGRSRRAVQQFAGAWLFR